MAKTKIFTLLILTLCAVISAQEAVISLGSNMGTLYYHKAFTKTFDNKTSPAPFKKSRQKKNKKPTSAKDTLSENGLESSDKTKNSDLGAQTLQEADSAKSFDKNLLTEDEKNNKEPLATKGPEENTNTFNTKKSDKENVIVKVSVKAGENILATSRASENKTDSKSASEKLLSKSAESTLTPEQNGKNNLKSGGAKNSFVAVIIAPGGSYHHLGLFNEGNSSAKWFTARGVAAFVLRYRTAQNGFHNPAMAQDVFEAVRKVRKLGFKTVGVVGYSAGGHLALTAGIFGEGETKPDFIVSVYPVVSMEDPIAHRWSRKSLLGRNPSALEKERFSMEKQVSAQMSSAYIVACFDDEVVKVENSIAFFDAAKAVGAPVRLTLYPWGGHGFGMTAGKFMSEFSWNEELWTWMKNEGFVEE